MIDELKEQIRSKAAEVEFSGAVSVWSGEQVYEEAFGLRDRANELPVTNETRFGIASGTKGFTALAIGILIEEERLKLDTRVRSILEDRIENLHPEITVQQLLEHTSGIGDHYDEEEIGDGVDDFLLSIPVQNLYSPFDYVPLLEEKPQKFPPGEKACYSNGGYVTLSMIVETVASIPFHEFVEERIFGVAEMTRSGFFRSDSLPGNTALGYVSDKDRLKTNIFNLPIIGSGDGGAYSTASDIDRFWLNLKSGKILSLRTLAPFVKAQNCIDDDWYGFGFWIDKDLNRIELFGHDAGVSFYSSTSRQFDETFTVISNTSTGAWPLGKLMKNRMLQQNAAHDQGSSATSR